MRWGLAGPLGTWLFPERDVGGHAVSPVLRVAFPVWERTCSRVEGAEDLQGPVIRVSIRMA
jgi:hypothetical protein